MGQLEALCRSCHSTIRYHRSSTSNLKRHLLRRHPGLLEPSLAELGAAAAEALPVTAPVAAVPSSDWAAVQGRSAWSLDPA